MKHIKLFEAWDGLDKEDMSMAPKKIKVRLTDNWKDRLGEMKDDNLRGHIPLGLEELTLYPEQWFLVGLGPYEYRNGEKRTFFYAEYEPKKNRICVHTINCFGNKFIEYFERLSHGHPGVFHNILNNPDNTDVQFTDTTSRYKGKGGVFYAGGIDCEFVNGFNIGEMDSRRYFEITDIN
jgi:hypothetical protein